MHDHWFFSFFSFFLCLSFPSFSTTTSTDVSFILISIVSKWAKWIIQILELPIIANEWCVYINVNPSFSKHLLCTCLGPVPSNNKLERSYYIYIFIWLVIKILNALHPMLKMYLQICSMALFLDYQIYTEAEYEQ